MATDESGDIGPHAMVLKVTLDEYGLESDQDFDIQIDACLVLSLTAGQYQDQAYAIGEPAKTLSLPPYT